MSQLSVYSFRRAAAQRRRMLRLRARLGALIAFATVLCVPQPAWAQKAKKGVAPINQATADSLAAAHAESLARAGVVRRHAIRGSWYSDRLPLDVGDVITIVVDEQTAAQERVSNVAVGNRWFDWLCTERGLEPLSTYARLAATFRAPTLRAPFNIAARRAAGFSEAELLALTGAAPL